MPAYGRFCWFNDCLEPKRLTLMGLSAVSFSYGILPDIKSEEIKSRTPIHCFQSMSNPGLFGFQAQPHRFQLRFNQLFYFLDNVEVVMDRDQIVGVSHDDREIESASGVAGVLLGHGLFNSMDGDIRQEG